MVPCPSGLTSCVAVLRYEGAGRDLVTALKYRNHRAALDRLARAGAARVVGAVDVVTWPPTSAARRRRRGYDQAELAARAVAGHLGRPARPLLRREGGPPQTGRSAADRRDGPRFTARRGAAARVAGARVLLVDDVVTTGATLRAAARVLAELGADEVHGLALARTPAPGADGVQGPREGAGRPTVLKRSRGRSDTRREAGGGSSLTVDGRDATD